MRNIEDDVRQLLNDEARSAPPPRETGEVIERTRRRQGTVVVAGVLAVVALAAASFVGLRAVVTAERSRPAAEPTVTTTLNGISITHPETWRVIDPDEAGLNGPEATPSLPRLVLAMTPTEPGDVFGCPGLADGPAPTFLMTVEEQPLALTGDAARQWPVELESLDVGPSESACYPGWTFSQATWTAGGRTFDARIGFAPESSEGEREAVATAFGTMTFEPVGTVAPAAAVLDMGEIGGETWQLIASRGDGGLELSLETEDAGAGIGGFVIGSPDLQFGELVVGSGDGARLVVFGAVPPGTAKIECPDPVGLRTLDVPDAIDDRFDAFLAVIDVGLEVELHALDADGNVLASGGAGSESNDPVETPPPGDVLFRGRTNECFWTLSGSRLLSDTVELALTSSEGETLVRERMTVNSVAPPLQLASYACDMPPGGVLVFGLASDDVAEIRWAGVPESGAGGAPECIDATIVEGFCLLVEDFPNGGEAIAFDADGNEIGRAGFG